MKNLLNKVFLIWKGVVVRVKRCIYLVKEFFVKKNASLKKKISEHINYLLFLITYPYNRLVKTVVLLIYRVVRVIRHTISLASTFPSPIPLFVEVALFIQIIKKF